MITRLGVAATVVAVAAVALPAARAQDSFALLTSRPLAPGVSHEVWQPGGSTALVNLARVAATAPVELVVVPATGGLAGGRETPSSICNRTPLCLAGVNGDYFTDDGPVGGVIVENTMLRSPRPGHEQLSLAPLRATSAGLGRQGWSGTVTPAGGRPVSLSGVNVPLRHHGLVLYTSAYGPTTPACSCVELLLEGPAAATAGRLDATQVLTPAGRSAGGTPLSERTVVLAGHGPAGGRLAALDTAAVEQVRLAVRVAAKTSANVGAHPILMNAGRPARYDVNDPMLAQPSPRTAVGWDFRGRVWLVTIDGRQPGGPGLTAAETVEFLRDRGVENAVLEDGGGSTSFVVRGQVRNRPSDGAERPVANAVLLIASPRLAAARRSDIVQTRVDRTGPGTAAPAALPLRPLAQPAPGRPVRPARPLVAARPARPPAAVRAAPLAVPPAPNRLPAEPAAPVVLAQPLGQQGLPWPAPTALLLVSLAALAWLRTATQAHAGTSRYPGLP